MLIITYVTTTNKETFPKVRRRKEGRRHGKRRMGKGRGEQKQEEGKRKNMPEHWIFKGCRM